MTHYSIESTTRKYDKGYGFFHSREIYAANREKV